MTLAFILYAGSSGPGQGEWATIGTCAIPAVASISSDYHGPTGAYHVCPCETHLGKGELGWFGTFEIMSVTSNVRTGGCVVSQGRR